MSGRTLSKLKAQKQKFEEAKNNFQRMQKELYDFFRNDLQKEFAALISELRQKLPADAFNPENHEDMSLGYSYFLTRDGVTRQHKSTTIKTFPEEKFLSEYLFSDTNPCIEYAEVLIDRIIRISSKYKIRLQGRSES